MYTPGLHDIVCMYSCIPVQWVLCFVFNVNNHCECALAQAYTNTKECGCIYLL